MVMYSVTDGQFQLVYNVLSFSFASMMATTLFLWMRVPAVAAKYQNALLISGLVTFIAAYHYLRIFNSWTEAYKYPVVTGGNHTWGASGYPAPEMTGVPFNDAYRYMDWLLTVPLLLIEIVLCMNMSSDESSSKCKQLGISSAVMIILGYPGELIVQGNLGLRWMCWAAAMVPFLFVVYTLLISLAEATNREMEPVVKSLIQRAQLVTVLSWLTYPIVYLFPMLGLTGAQAVVAVQCGYCASDIIAKCGVGLFIYQITAAKSENEMKKGLLT